MAYRLIPWLLPLLVALAAPAPVRAADPIVGLGAHQLDARSVAALRQLGVRHVRHTLYVDVWDRDEAYRREFDRGIERASAAGLELLIVAHAIGENRMSPRERRRTAEWYAGVMERAARRYRDQVRYWQIWNEMDVTFTDAFGARSGLPMRERGRLYAEQLQLVYPRIKAANSRAVVITGGIASGPADGFLDAVLEAGGPFDVAAVHTYGFPLWGVFEAKARQTRAILRRHGAGARPLWNTEFGLEGKQIPWTRDPAKIDELQAETWSRAVRGNAAEGLYDRLYGYQLWTGEDTGHGILREDFSPRPAAGWLRTRNRGG